MLSKIENGQTSPSLGTIAALAGALEVPVTALFRGLEEEHDAIYVPAGQGIDIEHQEMTVKPATPRRCLVRCEVRTGCSNPFW